MSTCTPTICGAGRRATLRTWSTKYAQTPRTRLPPCRRPVHRAALSTGAQHDALSTGAPLHIVCHRPFSQPPSTTPLHSLSTHAPRRALVRAQVRSYREWRSEPKPIIFTEDDGLCAQDGTRSWEAAFAIMMSPQTPMGPEGVPCNFHFDDCSPTRTSKCARHSTAAWRQQTEIVPSACPPHTLRRCSPWRSVVTCALQVCHGQRGRGTCGLGTLPLLVRDPLRPSHLSFTALFTAGSPLLLVHSSLLLSVTESVTAGPCPSFSSFTADASPVPCRSQLWLPQVPKRLALVCGRAAPITAPSTTPSTAASTSSEHAVPVICMQVRGRPLLPVSAGQLALGLEPEQERLL